jgi:hypothetical protein
MEVPAEAARRRSASMTASSKLRMVSDPSLCAGRPAGGCRCKFCTLKI